MPLLILSLAACSDAWRRRDAREYWRQIAQDATHPDEERAEASRQLTSLEEAKP